MKIFLWHCDTDKEIKNLLLSGHYCADQFFNLCRWRYLLALEFSEVSLIFWTSVGKICYEINWTLYKHLSLLYMIRYRLSEKKNGLVLINSFLGKTSTIFMFVLRCMTFLKVKPLFCTWSNILHFIFLKMNTEFSCFWQKLL